ncbi:MAG TPA: hypothetical protein VFB84_20945 [Micromonosporaceae bacterium]|nr:hypothetical protein [Micromonosporaceae bacterium]
MASTPEQQLANLKQAYRDGRLTGADYRDERWLVQIEAQQDAERAAQAQRWLETDQPR